MRIQILRKETVILTCLSLLAASTANAGSPVNAIKAAIKGESLVPKIGASAKAVSLIPKLSEDGKSILITRKVGQNMEKVSIPAPAAGKSSFANNELFQNHYDMHRIILLPQGEMHVDDIFEVVNIKGVNYMKTYTSHVKSPQITSGWTALHGSPRTVKVGILFADAQFERQLVFDIPAQFKGEVLNAQLSADGTSVRVQMSSGMELEVHLKKGEKGKMLISHINSAPHSLDNLIAKVEPLLDRANAADTNIENGINITPSVN